VGDGNALSPIDYMVWKEQVNVLDQNRIFKLLAKGPRLDGYLNQIRRADRLDFASWGGFAQNFAGKRIPFDHPGSAKYWESLSSDQLFIPTFATANGRPFLPGSALKGALRTAMVSARVSEAALANLGDRPGAAPIEAQSLGRSGSDAFRNVSVGDSLPTAAAATRVYLVRTSTIEARGGQPALGWKQGRGAPQFFEMAAPGTQFEGQFTLAQGHSGRKVPMAQLVEAANRYAGMVIGIHRRYARMVKLVRVEESMAALESRLASLQPHAVLLPLGWGAGYLGKTLWPRIEEGGFRKVLGEMPFYSRAIRTGMPFPKTRRVVFMENQPATLPGWVLAEFE
jgi:CRISPR-associated protein Csm5